MGRQIAILATQEDVDNLLAFMRSTTEIAIFGYFAESIEGLWTDNPQLSTVGMFHVWNKRFAWSPQYGRVGAKAHNPEHIGWYYVANTNVAPVVEVSPGYLKSDRAGRIYWSKDFATSHGLPYDVAKFTEWYETVVKWVRRNGRKRTTGFLQPYYLPGAWKEIERGQKI
jgi:hypothetical protein